MGESATAVYARAFIGRLCPLFLVLWVLLEWSADAVSLAQPAFQGAAENCTACHQDAARAHIRDWDQSVHARSAVACVSCHAGGGQDQTGATPRSADRPATCRDGRLEAVAACERCHQEVARAFRESQHSREASHLPATPICIDCHSAAGGSTLSDDLIPQRCATCHGAGGTAAGTLWVTEKALELLRLLRRVTLARTMDKERLEVLRRLGEDTTSLEAELVGVDANFRDIPFEWHRFNLEGTETRSRRALAILESLHDRLERRVVRDETGSRPSEASAGAAAPQKRVLRLAVASILNPVATYDNYRALFDDLARSLGRPYEFVQRRTYRELNELLLRGEVDLAFLCSGGYAALPSDAPIEIIASPVVKGENVYHSLVVVRKNSPVRRFEELEGSRFAFSDPLSNTGYLYPVFRVTMLGKDPQRFFASTLFSGSHDRSLLAVYRGLADAAAVNEFVYNDLVVPRSPYWDQLRILEASPDFGAPPVVAPTSVPAEVRARMREFLLDLGATVEGRERLASLGIDRFVAGETDLYRSIRAMREATVAKPH